MTMNSTEKKSALKNARVLILEDEWMIATHMVELLEDYGCKVVGPANRIAKALELVSAEAIDGALLDLNVAGETAYGVAQALRDRGVPFTFVTGYSSGLINEDYRDRASIQKPINATKFRQALESMLSAAEDARKTS